MSGSRLSSEDRKKQIATVAAALFAKKGFSGVTTREIAKRARVNESILFRHFPTKETLYTEIINQKIQVQPEILFDTGAVQKGDDATVFKDVALLMIRSVEEDNTFLRLMLYSALEDHALASLFLKSRTIILFDFMIEYITRRTTEGAFKKGIKPAVAVRAFMGMFFHYIMVTELFKVPKQLRISRAEAVEQFVEIFLDGLKK